MSRPFIDYYEILQLSPRATAETVESVYRILAKRYHPDNQQTGNADKFTDVHDAYQVLSDAARRAEFDASYENERALQWKVFDQASAPDGRADDRRIIHAILSLLYIERRRNPRGGGLGIVIMERLLGVPEDHLQFPLWYIKEHGWTEVLDSGQMAITIAGIDRLGDEDLHLSKDRLLPAHHGNPSTDSEDLSPADQPRNGMSTDGAVPSAHEERDDTAGRTFTRSSARL